MPALLGTFSFPGVNQVLSGSFTLSHGITPSVAVLTILPQAGFVAEVGTLEIRFGSERLRFPDCRINMPAVQRGQGGTLLSFQLLDRRWKWQGTNRVSGKYNVRKPNGEIDRSTEKTPQQLAALLLDAMGERRYSVGALPDDQRPLADWDYATPAPLLDSLAAELGCRVVLGLDNRVRILRTGAGADLPRDGRMLEGYGAITPRRPDSLEFVGGPTQFQLLFELEAVGLDSDGRVKPIGELSYAPAAGWGNESERLFFGVQGTTDVEHELHRQLALRTVFRWYRVKQLATGDLNVPGYRGTIERVDQLLPLAEHLLEVKENPDPAAPEQEQYQPALLEGRYYDGTHSFRNTPFGTQFDGDFRINGAEGRVELSKAAYRLSSDGTSIEPAALFLLTSCALTETGTLQPLRTTVERRLGGRRHGTGPLIIRRDEVCETFIGEYVLNASGDGFLLDAVTDNRREVQEGAGYWLDAVAAEFDAEETLEMEYQGIRAIAPDGAVQQVTWHVGPGGATTRASRNTEHNRNILGYHETRRLIDQRRKSEQTESELRQLRRELHREGRRRRK